MPNWAQSLNYFNFDPADLPEDVQPDVCVGRSQKCHTQAGELESDEGKNVPPSHQETRVVKTFNEIFIDFRHFSIIHKKI